MKIRSLLIIYATAFIFSFHVALTAYANSSFAETLVSERFVGLLYGISSLCTLFGLTLVPKIVCRIGNKKTALFSFLGSIALLSILATTTNPILGIIAFILYLSFNTFTFFALDIFVEHYSNDRMTGKIRGLYLLAINAGWVLAPMVSGTLISEGGFSMLYSIGSLLVLCAAIVLGISLKNFKDGICTPLLSGNAFKELWSIPKLRTITIINFLLQFFFSWMVIYTPLYLTDVIGLSWQSIGIIFTIMLIPFVIMEFPVGLMLDRGFSSKKIIQTGFLISLLATAALAFIHTPSILPWAILLFLTRVGASFVEATAEVSFFKNINASNAHLLGVFRDMTPLAYIVGPVLASLLLFAGFDMKYLFIILALILTLGIYMGRKLTPHTNE